MSTQVRPASGADAPAMQLVDRLATSRPWPRSRIELCCGGAPPPAPRALVVESAGDLRGFLVYSAVLDEATLENIVIHPDSRRLGLASELLSAALGEWRRARLRRCLLEVRASNLAAAALYRKFGFRPDGTRPGYYPADGAREDAVLMSLALAAEDREAAL